MARRTNSTCLPLAAAVILAGVGGLPALSQGLPAEIGRRVDRALENRVIDGVERRVDESVARKVETLRVPELPPLPDLPARLADPLANLPDPAQSIVGTTLGAVPEAAGLAQGIVQGVVPATAGRSIDIDTTGSWPVVRDEWILIAEPGDAARLEAAGVRILEDTLLTSSGERLLVVSLSSDDPGARQIGALLRELGAEIADRNHVYVSAAPAGAESAARAAQAPASAMATGGLARLGLIDTDVDETHPALTGLPLTEEDFVTMGSLRPQGHGTAVASILARELPAAPDAPPVRAASVFFLAEDGTTGATSASLVRALDWMISEQVSVINFSLAGPPNRALEVMIERSLAAGIVIVAAVGNEGPAAKPLYPAGYPGVIGVTAVDSEGRVYRWANRGEQVAVAALGVNVEVARPGGTLIRDSGTSFAAPVVSAWIARQISGGQPQEPLSLIRAAARPAARSGRDEIHGYGILAPAHPR